MSDENDKIQELEEQLAQENAAVESVKAAQAEADLPPKGDKRREAMQRKAAKLIAEAERLTSQLEGGSVDRDSLKVENEVRASFNEFNEVYVSNALDDSKYIWIFRDPHNEYGGRFVRRMQALGWKVVQGDDKEAWEHRHVDGTRVVADCLLMKIRLDAYAVLQQRDRLLREAQQAGVYANVFDVADQTGVRVWDQSNMPDIVSQGLGDTAMSQRQARALGRFHAGNRNGTYDRMLKQGTIPGIPPTGVRRVAPFGRQS